MRVIGFASIATLLIVGLAATAPVRAQGTGCQLEISGNDAIQFDKKELKVPASCKQVTLTLKHIGKMPVTAMGHNWVLTRTADSAGVASDGMKAGQASSYLKPGDARVIAATKMVGGGESTSVKFSTAALKKGEAYTYVCTFPGHSAVMRGTLTFG
jgi:azurin